VSGITRAAPADAGALSQLIAAAFFDLPPSRWLIGDPAARRQILPGYFVLLVEHALTAGIVSTTADRAAVALWIPVGDQPPGPPVGYDARLRAATGHWASRFLAFDAALEKSHPSGVAHHHLAILAVRPGRQGQGTGTALLRHHHQALDRAGAPAYLEAADERSRRLYARHGYADHGLPIQLGADGPAMLPMWREPQRMPDAP